MALKDRKIAFIGGGHITTTIITNLLRNNTVSYKQLIVSDPDKDRLKSFKEKWDIRGISQNVNAINQADLVFICVLPQVLGDLISELGNSDLWLGKTLISVAAGISIKNYENLSFQLPVIRALPNPGSMVGEGVIALAFNKNVEKENKNDVLSVFAPMGECIIMEEKNINAMTSLSSPVMVYRFIKALIKGGIESGIDKSQSEKIVLQTIMGSLQLLKEQDFDLDELLKEAASPGGISEQCLLTLDKFNFDEGLVDAVKNGKKQADNFSMD